MDALIFDLDNCLASAREVGEALFAPAFDAIRRANRGTLSAEALEAALHDCWIHALDFVAAKHGFSPAMLAAGWETFRRIEVRDPMHGYGDLHVLRELGRQRFLVTSGFRRLQESKIRALGIETRRDRRARAQGARNGSSRSSCSASGSVRDTAAIRRCGRAAMRFP